MTDPIILQRQRDLLDCLLDLQKQMEKQAVEDSKFWVEIINDLDTLSSVLNSVQNNISTLTFSKSNLSKYPLAVRNKIASRHIKKNGGSKD